MVTNTRPTTSLDFDDIKTDIIDYIKGNPTFSDYNFEGSALNAIADILAYNTHNMAYYANMLHGETFLDSAQKRSSVVSRAKEMGYLPKSTTCSTAYVDITVNGGTSNAYYITRGTVFSSSNDNGSYPFVVADDATSTLSGVDQKFLSLKLVNGTYISNYFKMDLLSNVRSMFRIPNKNIDLSTLRLFVRNSPSAIERTLYTLGENVYESLPTNRTFFIQESYDGYYQIYFGQNVLGVQPIDGAVIEIDYFVSTELDAADGCRSFAFNGTIGSSTSVTIVTTQVSFGGADKEDINSIKINAVKSNSARERAVTASDYQLAIQEQFSFIKSVAVWGGEDNVPPVYGKVFIAIQPVSGFTVSNSVKRDVILPLLKSRSLVTVIPEIVDPAYISLEFTVNTKINPHKTTTSVDDIKGAIVSSIRSFVSNVSKFNTDLLHSTIIANILNVDPGIVSAEIAKRVGFRISPLSNIVSTFTNSVNNPIVRGSIESTKFNIVNGNQVVPVRIRELNTTTTTNTVSIGMFDDNGTLIAPVGTADLDTGNFNFTLSVYSYLTGNRYIQMYCTSKLQDILTARNQIVVLNTSVEDPVIGLLPNITVNTEIYIK